MSITHGSFTFTGTHGPLVQGPLSGDVQIYQVAGVRGESHLVDEIKGCDWTCTYLLSGYSTAQLLEDEIRSINNQKNELSGTLTVSGGITLQRMTFLGFERNGPKFYDGSGVYDWVQRGRLFWRQRRISSS